MSQNQRAFRDLCERLHPDHLPRATDVARALEYAQTGTEKEYTDESSEENTSTTV